MELKNAKEDLSFDLNAAPGWLRAKGTNAKKKLRMDKRRIVINGVSVSGSQDFY